MGLVLIGAGGHARVVLDAAQACGLTVDGLLDTAREAGDTLAGAPILGGDEHLDDSDFVRAHGFHVSISDPVAKTSLVNRLNSVSARFETICHPGAIISSSATLADGVFVNAGAVINAGAQIGAHVIVNTRASVDHDNEIGPGAHIAPGVTVCGDVVVGAGARVGPGAVLGRGARVGAGAVIGAGAVVIADVPDGARVWGVPARPAP
jgi:sugar O-acyltransferase (sialic acid O-acetyltransferase NeuD family)